MCDASHSQKRSVVETSSLPMPIERGNQLVALGSCFAQYMGDRMLHEGFDVMINPLGTLFNPFSIGQTIQAALDADTVELPLFYTEVEKDWRCWWANTKIKALSSNELESDVRSRLRLLGKYLRQSSHLVMTFGTNVCYKLQNGLVVSNCQRQPDRLFTEWRASVKDIVEYTTSTVERLLYANPDLHIVFTVSPYRYHKYGYHGSQLSKASLLLAEDEIVKRFPQSCSYFPAYEIMLDELRDYRYYASDGHHPGPDAVDVIWQRFYHACCKE